MQCEADDACTAIQGSKVNDNKQCLQKAMFYACVPAGDCGQALTAGCDPNVDPPQPVIFPNTCLPPGWEACEGPVDLEPC
jgi:hypothetical protein